MGAAAIGAFGGPKAYSECIWLVMHWGAWGGMERRGLKRCRAADDTKTRFDCFRYILKLFCDEDGGHSLYHRLGKCSHVIAVKNGRHEKKGLR